jgi:hypothetical protein
MQLTGAPGVELRSTAARRWRAAARQLTHRAGCACSLVRLGVQPPAAPVAQYGVQAHHPLNHAADRVETAIAVVRLPDGFVERLVVNVVETPSPNRSWLDGSGESASDQAGHELAAVLAACRTGERAVLPLQKASGVDHDSHEELALSQRQAVLTEGGDAADADAVEGPVGRVFVRHRNSSTTRGCGAERPPPPRDPTT